MNARDCSLISFLLVVVGAVLALLFSPYLLLPFVVIAAVLMGLSTSKYSREQEGIVEYFRQGLSGELSKEILKDVKDIPSLGKVNTQLERFKTASSTASKVFTSYMSLLSAASSKVKELINSTRRGISKINDTFGELLKLSDEVQTVLEKYGEFETKMENTLNSLAKIQEEVARYAEIQEDMRLKTSELEDLVESFEDVFEGVMEIEKTWKGLLGKLDEVLSLSNIIREIAERTNLLSLNAAIEAARVGRKGHGFGVVAESIKALSEETSLHAERIEREISKTGSVLNNLSERMNSLVDELQNSRRSISSFRSLMKSLIEGSTGSIRAVEFLRASLDDITKRQLELRKNVEKLREGIESIMGLVDDIRGMFNALSTEIEEKFGEIETELRRFLEKKEKVEENLQKVSIMVREGVDIEMALKECYGMMRNICSITYLGTEDGSLWVFPEAEVKGVDPRDRPWYKKGIKAELPEWTEPYIDYLSGDLVATCVLRIILPGGKKGVVAADVPIKKLLGEGS